MGMKPFKQTTNGVKPFKQITDGDKALQTNHGWGKAQKRYTTDGHTTQYNVSVDGEVIIPWGQIPPIRNLAEVVISRDKTHQPRIWQKFSSIKAHAEIAINQST